MTELKSLHGVDLFRLHQLGGTKHERGDRFMNHVGLAFRTFCKSRKIEKPPCTWNLHLIGRGANDEANQYPVLDSNVKAAHCKPIIFFLAEVAREIGSYCKCHLDGF